MHSTLKRILFLWMASLAMAPAVVAQMASGIPPHGKLVRLFNGKDFTGFDILLQSKGLNHDTDKIFQVEKGIIHVSGNDFGGIVTPTRRRVFRRNPDGTSNLNVPSITIDVDDVTFS